MITNRDIVVVGISSSCKNIALEFSKYNRVLYVNSSLDFITAHRNKEYTKIVERKNIIREAEEDLVRINSNLWYLSPRTQLFLISKLGTDNFFNFLNKKNNEKFAKQIQIAISRLEFKDFILFNDRDIFKGLHLKEILKPKSYVYHTRDNLIAVDYWKKQGLITLP